MSELMRTQEKLWKDTDKIIEPQQGSHDLFIIFHDNVNSGADTFIHQLCKREGKRTKQQIWTIQIKLRYAK